MEGKITKQFIVTLVLIFVLQFSMMTYIFSSVYKRSVNDVMDMGVSNLNSQVTQIDNYLNKGSNILWLAADSVDYMVKEGMDSDVILEYLTEETKRMQEQFDENFTGIYGYVNGGYVDGSGWIPPEGYDPKGRAWYMEAEKAGHKMVISNPYVDAQTGETVVSFSQMLSDDTSVIALDIVLNQIQSYVEDIKLGGNGYGFIMDSDGMVIAHDDRSKIGKKIREIGDYDNLAENLYNTDEKEFSVNVGGEKCTVFSNTVVKDWRLVIVARDSSLFKKIRGQLYAAVALSLLIYLIIVVFCGVSVKRISKAESNEQISMSRLSRMNMGIIKSLTSAIDAKDRYTSGHSQRVSDYAVRIARKMGKTDEELKVIAYAGLLHDVGKIRVPVEVINKPGKLTDEEFDQIRIHPVSGFHILKGIFDNESVRYGAKYHHERYDGRGYPNGIEGENIPEISRIIAVADAYDAMASNRSYRKALPQEVVRSEIEKGKGTQFDPKIADIMLRIIDEDKEYRLKQERDLEWNILVVDDEPMNIKVAKRILNNMGNISVFEALSSSEAFKVLERNEISLILLDLLMPGIDGFTLFTQIRQKYDIPVILMTADKSSDTIKRIRELGINDYITKPVNSLVLQETIHGVLHDSNDKLKDSIISDM